LKKRFHISRYMKSVKLKKDEFMGGESFFSQLDVLAALAEVWDQ